MSHQIELDVNEIKQQLKNYLKGKPQFSDYNFEGSNISALLDVLSYNTYLNNLYLNMAVNEMFLDTAVTEDAIRSHSKELNYTPRSRRSAMAQVRLTIGVDDGAGTILIPKGTSFTTTSNSQSFSFSTAENTIASVDLTSNVATIDLNIYEGNYKSEFFINNAANTAQRYIIQDNKIDTDSLTVTVRVSESDNANGVYTLATDLFGLTPTSNVFFLQADNDGKYEITFGNGVAGRALENGNVVEANYRISSGGDANGAKTFSVGTIAGYSNTSVALVNNNTYAQGGALREDSASIKFNAPRHYQTLQRAVTASDYRNLIIAEFPEIAALTVYGGEDENPPRYGRVIISADSTGGDGISNQLKEQIREFVNSKSPVSIEADFVNADFLEAQITTTVRYNINVTTQSIADIRTKVLNAITSFNTANLGDFNKTLRFSKLIAAIDASDPSILGNSTTIRAIRKISPQFAEPNAYAISFANALTPDHFPPSPTQFANYVPAIVSGPFTYDGATCYLEDDTTGIVDIVNYANDRRNVVEPNIGTIDYQTGLLNIGLLTIDGYTGDGVKIYGTVADPRIVSAKNLIMQIKSEDVTIRVVQERE